MDRGVVVNSVLNVIRYAAIPTFFCVNFMFAILNTRLSKIAMQSNKLEMGSEPRRAYRVSNNCLPMCSPSLEISSYTV